MKFSTIFGDTISTDPPQTYVYFTSNPKNPMKTPQQIFDKCKNCKIDVDMMGCCCGIAPTAVSQSKPKRKYLAPNAIRRRRGDKKYAKITA